MLNNFSGILQKAQSLQKNMANLDKEINETSFEGTSGAGLATVKIKGDLTISSINVDDSLLKEDKETMLDLIAAAFNDAKSKRDKVKQEKMSVLTAGMPIPPGFGL